MFVESPSVSMGSFSADGLRCSCLHQKISLIDRRSDDMIKQAASGRKDSKFVRVQLQQDGSQAALPACLCGSRICDISRHYEDPVGVRQS